MATMEDRVSRIEGTVPHLATKEDIATLSGDVRSEIAELRGEMRALRWLMGGVGVALAALTLILKYLG